MFLTGQASSFPIAFEPNALGMNMTIACALIAATAIVATAAERPKVDVSKLPPPARKTGVTYAKDIRPLLQNSCFKCHGEEKQKGNLRFDSLDAALKGGEGGKVIVAGKSDQSPMVIAVARLDADSAMPPEGKGDALAKEQVGLIRAWIDQGAK
jgi:mono/diheme cytochrome c family protein